MYDERRPHLILADGTLLADSDCGYAEHELHCWVRHFEMAEVFAMFTDPEKTKLIRFCYLGHETLYRDFINMFLIRKMEDCIDVRLSGGIVGETINSLGEE